jgi:hypothetical protein
MQGSEGPSVKASLDAGAAAPRLSTKARYQRISMHRIALPAVIAVLASGCYRYVPLTTTSLPAGTRAQVVLTDAGTAELARLVGPASQTIEGSVVNGGETNLTVAVHRLERRNGVEEFWNGEAVPIPRTAVASVARRDLSWQRSVLLGAGLVVAGFALGSAFGSLDTILGRGDSGTGSTR